jgi:phosphate transport system permease protein
MNRALAVDRAWTAVLWATALLVVGILISIIGYFVIQSIGTLSPGFIVGSPSNSALGGIGPLIFNSFYILILTLIITVPLGILGGIYMAEYAGAGRLPNLIRLSQELISSVPSIVVGLFGLALFVTATGWGYTAIAGALALTVFNLPLLSRLTEQAIRAVPRDERSGSLALGTTKWQTIRHIVLPISISGIVTGIILTSGRIFGEAAALIFTAGVASPFNYDYTNFNLTDPRSPWSPFHPATTLSVFIWKLKSEGLGKFADEVALGSAAVLIIIVLLFNVGARALSRVLQRRYGGAG